MTGNQEILNNLQQLLKYKKSKAFYAKKLNISELHLEELLNELKGRTNTDLSKTTEVNNDKGTLTSTVEVSYEPKNDVELAKLHKIDLTKYKISNYWTKLKSNGKFTSSVFCTLKKLDSPENLQKVFIDFLKEFTPRHIPDYLKGIKDNTIRKESKPQISLILPKQDAHFNKFDINGNNDIEDRFTINDKATWRMLEKACSVNYLKEVVYIVGSDQFNSEWTSLTTKGTPQQNILSYQDSFKAISNHEIGIIQNLLHFSEKVKVVFIPGNHDEFVGWHLINLLETYFKNESNISFDSSTLNTKYHKFGNTALMFNHGDAIKPRDLAQKFPIGFKQEWSSCDNYIILTGDKHHEMSLDIQGIKFYQVPQLSKATSKWDDKMGYIDNKAEMTAFVITETNGISDIYKEIL